MYNNPSISDVLLISLIGFATVFIVLVVLMGIIKLISLFGASKPVAVAPAPSAPAPSAPTSNEVVTGQIDPKTVATLMAIVANEMEEPLERLRFISIKEVK